MTQPTKFRAIARRCLAVFGYAMILGGVVRVFTTEELFIYFGIESLWTTHDYSRYIYSVLGGFVILTGFNLVIVARDLSRYKNLLIVWSAAFFLIGLIMVSAGIYFEIPLIYCIPDVLFCLLLAGVLGFAVVTLH